MVGCRVVGCIGLAVRASLEVGTQEMDAHLDEAHEEADGRQAVVPSCIFVEATLSCVAHKRVTGVLDSVANT